MKKIFSKKIFNQRGLGVLISAIIVLIVGISLIGLVLISFGDSLNSLGDREKFEASQNALKLIDGQVQSVIQEGFGAKKTFFVRLEEPLVLSDANTLLIRLSVSKDFVSNLASQTQGNLTIDRNGSYVNLHLDYNQIRFDFNSLSVLNSGSYNIVLTFNDYNSDLNQSTVVFDVA